MFPVRTSYFVAILLAILPTLLHAQWLVASQTGEVPFSKNAGTAAWSAPSKPPVVRSASGRQLVVPADRPSAALFSDGTIVTTGFPGLRELEPFVYRDGRTKLGSDEDYLTIDLNGASAILLRSDNIGFAPNASEITTPPYDKILARDVGLVFGIAIDQERDRNLYLTATSAFGLHVVGEDQNHDRVQDRLVTGRAEARWMNGQWGSAPSAGPGSVWKVDGATGQVSLLANIALNGVENPGASLGNIAFDARHKQLFVSDRHTGMIHRLDLDGRDLGHFDHGMSALERAGEPTISFDPSKAADIKNRDFDAEDADTWGFADERRLVWGLAVSNGRLYYAVADGPAVWSVGLDTETGDFLKDSRWELTIGAPLPGHEISDMVFDSAGGLVLAQRGKPTPDFGFEEFARQGRAEVLRYVRETPDDPDTASVWVETPRSLPVGFAGNETNTTGGVDIGPAYDGRGNWDFTRCGGTLWTTGEQLRNRPDLKASLEINGELLVDGVQAQPAFLSEIEATPPWQTYHFDYDGAYPTKELPGHIGDVEVLGCLGEGVGEIYYVSGPPENGCDPAVEICSTTECIGDACLCDKPEGCDKDDPPPTACLDSFVKNICQAASGEFEAITIFESTTTGIDRIELKDLSGLLTLPADVSVDDILRVSLGTLSSGQKAQIRACGYNAVQKASGGPYDCCEVDLTLSPPDDVCEKGAE